MEQHEIETCKEAFARAQGDLVAAVARIPEDAIADILAAEKAYDTAYDALCEAANEPDSTVTVFNAVCSVNFALLGSFEGGEVGVDVSDWAKRNPRCAKAQAIAAVLNESVQEIAWTAENVLVNE